MKAKSLVLQAQEYVAQSLQPGEIAVDATVGNGHDTLFLSRTVTAQGKVFGFDSQAQAIHSARQRLVSSAVNNVTLYHCGHESLLHTIPALIHGHVRAVMFNLGYLPGSDKRVITQPDNTIKALNASLQLMSCLGRLTLIAYRGHQGGMQEFQRVMRWFVSLPTDKVRWDCVPHIQANKQANKETLCEQSDKKNFNTESTEPVLFKLEKMF